MTKNKLADTLNISLPTLYRFIRSEFFNKNDFVKNKKVRKQGKIVWDYTANLKNVKESYKKYKLEKSNSRKKAWEKRKNYSGILKDKVNLTTQEYLEIRKNEAKL